MGCYITHNTNGSIVQLNSIIPNSMGLRTIFKYPMTLRYEDITVSLKYLKEKWLGHSDHFDISMVFQISMFKTLEFKNCISFICPPQYRLHLLQILFRC